MTHDLIIANGTCATATGTFEADVAIEDGEIVALGDADFFPAADRVIDASGQLVMPGFIDPHVHIDDTASIDTYRTATGAAALGGITTLIDFAWLRPESDTANDRSTLLEGIERKQRKAEESGAYVDYSLHGSITDEDPAVLDELDAAVEMGIPSFKMFTAYDLAISNGFIRRSLERIADLDAVGVFHTEDESVIDDLVAEYREAGHADPSWFPRARPDYTEAMAADDVLRLAERTGAKYYGLHTSSGAAAEVIDAYRTDGSRVRAETCPHYMTFDERVFEEQGNLPLIVPPIRTAEDLEAIFDHLRSETLSHIATDHAPHYSEDKAADWWDSPYGVGGLQESATVVHEVAVNRRDFSYPWLVRTMSTNPAETFGFANKGTLDPGTDADIMLFDPEAPYTITAEDLASKVDFTIYEGMEVTGRVTKTFVHGELVAEDGSLVSEPDVGGFVEREVPDWSV